MDTNFYALLNITPSTVEMVIALALSPLVAALWIRAARRRLHSVVEHQVEEWSHELADYEERFRNVSSSGFDFMLSLSKESVLKLAEAQQIIFTVRESLDRAEELVVSTHSEDWVTASEILSDDYLPASKTGSLSGFSGASSTLWKDRLNDCLEVVGTEVFKVSQSYRSSFRSLREKVPSTVKNLVDSGIRCAVKHSQVEALRFPYRHRPVMN